MGHLHNVYDTDKHFVIDRVTKTIKDMSDSKTTLAQYDHNSERFTFELPRFIDGHDMSLCNRVRVHYINESEDKQNSTPGLYEVKDLHISEDADDIVLCSWLISQNATQFAGPLMFCIEFSCVSEDAVVEYSWHTAVHTWVSVGKGIRNSEAIVDMYADILEQWERELLEASRGGDWEATKDDPGYIQNKPFGEDVYDLIPYYTFFFKTQTPPTDYWGDPNWYGAYLTDRVQLKPKPGLNCSIHLEGNEYVCECIDVNGDGSVLLLGNDKWNGGNDNGLPFAIVFAYDETAIRIDQDALNISGYAAVMVKGPQVKMIDPKFIPPSDWEAQSYDPGYIRNKPFSDVREVLVNKDEQRVYQYLTASSHWPDKEEWFGATILEFTMPEVGGIYIVTYQGQEYVCECIDRDGDGSVLLLGDSDGVKSINDIYPFTLTFSEKECVLLANTDFTYIPDKGYFVKIRAGREYTKKLDARFLPAGLPYVEGEYVTILPETEIPFTENMAIFEYHSGLNVEAGKEYSVNWNGTIYKCIAQTLPSANTIGLGDLSGNGGSANGEPFTIHTDESYTVIFPLDGSTTLTMGIYEGEIIIHKIDPRCLPDGYAGGESGGSGESGGAGSGTVVVREGADWNAVEGEPGHIKNKPEFEWIATSVEQQFEVFPETQVGKHTSAGAEGIKEDPGFVAGEKYIVYYGGTPYECTAREYPVEGDGYSGFLIVLGNTAIDDKVESTDLPEGIDKTDTGEPFLVYTSYADGYGFVGGNLMRDDEPAGETVTIKIDGFTSEPVKMPGKFLAEGVPHIEGDGEATDTLTFDGNIESKDVTLGEGAYFVHMSPEYVESSELIGGTITIVGLDPDLPGGSQTITEDNVVDMTEVFGFPVYIVSELVMVLSQDVTEEGVALPKGINFMGQSGAFYVGELKAPSAVFVGGKTYHKLDNRLLDLDWVPILKEKYVIPEQRQSFESTNAVDGKTFYTASIALEEALEIPAGEQKKYVICLDGVNHTAKSMPESNTILADDRSAYIRATGGTVSQGEAGVEKSGFHTIALIDPAQSQTEKMPEEFLPESVDGVVIRSSTEGSTKKFRLTVDDSGTITATELT